MRMTPGDATMRMPRDRDSTMNTARATMKMVRLRIITTTARARATIMARVRAIMRADRDITAIRVPRDIMETDPRGITRNRPEKRKKRKRKERFSSEYPSWCF